MLYLSFLGMSVNAQEDTQELDSLSLAALLIKNKNYARAAGVLGQIKDPHEVIPEKYWGLLGLLELKQKRFSEALKAFSNAKKEGLASSDLYLGFAQAYLGLKQYDKGLKVLEDNKNKLTGDILYYQIKASLALDSGKSELGWQAIHAGMKRFPKALPLIKQKWFYLVENNLIEVSFPVAQKMADDYNLSALDLARMGQKYRQFNDFNKAITLGEMARLKDPKDEEIIKDLARSYIKLENITAAAQLFTELAHHHPKYLVEASELWRKAGHSVYAERLAMDIRDPVQKIKSNLTIALLNEDFNKMTQLGDIAVRTPLKDDQDIQYALAYAQFMVGNYEKVGEHLKAIQRDDLFKKAVALREAMSSCMEGETLCF